MKTIQWFPGHMQKARRLMKEKINLIDIIFELVDARIPFSSTNPFVLDIIGTKPKMVLLNKADKADPLVTEKWIKYFKDNGIPAIPINSLSGDGVRKISVTAKEVLKDKIDRDKEKGLKEKAIRAMIVGIPNVGKSTLINRLAKKKVARIGDKPGVTKSQQWIKVDDNLELLDTPGILWNKFEDKQIGFNLALTGAIRDEILPVDDVCIYGINYLNRNYPDAISNRFKTASMDAIEVLDSIGKLRGCIRGGEVDYERVYTIFLNELRGGQLGRLSFEVPN